MAQAKEYAMRNRQGSDWFSHDASSNNHQVAAADADDHQAAAAEADPRSIEPEMTDVTESQPATGGRAQMIKPVCNSNQWYKYDQKGEEPGSSVDGPQEAPLSTHREKMHGPHQGGGDWYSDREKEGTGGCVGAADAKQPRVVSSEGESYCRRDKVGTSSSWFAHDHAGEESAGVAATPRVTSTEGCNNATRMRGQSEDWFHHDGATREAERPHISRGRGGRPQSSDMHDIFHMSSE